MTKPTLTSSRADLDTYFLDVATVIATRATCDRLHVGCVMTRAKLILATGYNGAPRGLVHCDDAGHDMLEGHCVRTVHAEANALAQAAREGVRLDGATAYSTHEPCRLCFYQMVNAGIARVVYRHGSPNHTERRVRDAAATLGIEFRHHPSTPVLASVVEIFARTGEIDTTDHEVVCSNVEVVRNAKRPSVIVPHSKLDVVVLAPGVVYFYLSAEMVAASAASVAFSVQLGGNGKVHVSEPLTAHESDYSDGTGFSDHRSSVGLGFRFADLAPGAYTARVIVHASQSFTLPRLVLREVVPTTPEAST